MSKYKTYDYSCAKRMRAELPAENVMNGYRPRNKEQVGQLRVIAYRNGKFEEPFTARFFMGRSASASRVYCSLWTGDAARTFNGHGDAGGYGYDKESAALADAIVSAGIVLNMDISGVGSSAMRRAAEAIARALGYRRFTIIN